MATYDNPRPSSQPIGSTDPAVVKDDLITLDQMVETEETTVTTRTGKVRTSLKGILQLINDNIIFSTSQISDPLAFVDGTFDYTFTGFNASTSAIYVYSLTGTFPNQLLIPGVDYTFVDNVTSTITLTSSWSGGVLIAKSFDPLGIGNVPYEGNSFTRAELVVRGDLNNGDIVYVTDYGNAKCKIQPVGYVAQSGDFTIGTGQIAAIQRDSQGMYNIEWFGADGSDNTVDQLSAFNLAADRSNEDANGDTKITPIVIPRGDWRLSAPITQSSIWILMPNAVMYGLPAISPTNERDTAYLTGTVIAYLGVDQQRTIHAGDPNQTVQKYTGKGYTAELTGFGKIAGGVAGTAHTADRTTASEGVIGGSFIAVANNPTVPCTVYGTYFEAYKAANTHVDSNVQCLESTVFNDSTLVTASPYRKLNAGLGTTTNLWLTTGGIIQGNQQISGDTTMCIGMKGKEGSRYHRGIVVSEDTISTQEVLATPADHSWDWYGVKTDNTTEVRAARIRGRLANDDAGLFEVSIYDSSLAGYRQLYNFGLDNFTAGDSRTNLGAPLLAWQNLYVENSPTVTSDERYKTKRDGNGDIVQAEINAGSKIAKLPKIFQWAKDGELAKLHCSPMAQAVWGALESEGLDPELYGFVNNGDKWTIQPQELLWLVCYAQQEKIDNFESRLAALEALNG